MPNVPVQKGSRPRINL